MRPHARSFSLAMKLRQPPKAEMSRASRVASASTRKPFTPRPSDIVSVPIDSGAGIDSTKRPNSFAGIAQISTSMALPSPAATRSSPGLAGALPGNRNRR